MIGTFFLIKKMSGYTKNKSHLKDNTFIAPLRIYYSKYNK